jgi:hypothetical protein
VLIWETEAEIKTTDVQCGVRGFFIYGRKGKQEKTEWLNRRMDTHGNVFIWNFGKAGKCGL